MRRAFLHLIKDCGDGGLAVDGGSVKARYIDLALIDQHANLGAAEDNAINPALALVIFNDVQIGFAAGCFDLALHQFIINDVVDGCPVRFFRHNNVTASTLFHAVAIEFLFHRKARGEQ